MQNHFLIENSISISQFLNKKNYYSWSAFIFYMVLVLYILYVVEDHLHIPSKINWNNRAKLVWKKPKSISLIRYDAEFG